MTNHAEAAAPAPRPRPTPNKDYYFCKACGMVFYRRRPDDPFTDPATCPYCGANEEDVLKGQDGKPLRDPAGQIIPSLYKVRKSDQMPKWKSLWVLQKRSLPTRTAPNQFIQTPSLYVRDVFPRLTHLQRSIVTIIQFLYDHDKGFCAVGLRALAAYVTPMNRDTSVSINTIRGALAGLEQIRVKVLNPLGAVEERQFLRSYQIGRQPTQYFLSFPEVRDDGGQS